MRARAFYVTWIVCLLKYTRTYISCDGLTSVVKDIYKKKHKRTPIHHIIK